MTRPLPWGRSPPALTLLPSESSHLLVLGDQLTGPPALPLIAPDVCCSHTSCPGVSVWPTCDLLGRTTCSLLLGFDASGTSEHPLPHPRPGMGAWRWCRYSPVLHGSQASLGDGQTEVIAAIKASVTEPAGGREGELRLFSLADPPSSPVWGAPPGHRSVQVWQVHRGRSKHCLWRSGERRPSEPGVGCPPGAPALC